MTCIRQTNVREEWRQLMRGIGSSFRDITTTSTVAGTYSSRSTPVQSPKVEKNSAAKSKFEESKSAAFDESKFVES